MSTDHDFPGTDREAVLQRLSDVIEETHGRITEFEATSPAEQELLIKWIRTFGYLSGQYRQLLRDDDLDELQDEVELLDAATKVLRGRR